MPLTLYLLVPFAPLLAIVCVIVFLYERLFQNDREVTEANFTVARAWITVVEVVNFIVTFPLVVLGPLRPFFNPILTIIALPIYGIQPFLRICFWEPLFCEILPQVFVYWNNKTYQHQAVRSESREIRVIDILPGLPAEDVKVKLTNIKLDNEPFDALSYSWGSHLTLRRTITVNDRSFLVTDAVFRFLREIRHVDEMRRI